MLRNFLILSAIFLYFATWALIKPVYQGPDERGHENKVLTWQQYPWIFNIEQDKVNRCLANPLQFSKEAFLDKTRRLSSNDILTLKNTPSFNQQECSLVSYKHPAAIYPPAYYALLNLSFRTLNFITNVSPYRTQQLLRLLSAFLAAIVWLRIWLVLKASVIKNKDLFFLILLFNPATAFISGTVNPDALAIPLSHLFLLNIITSTYKSRFIEAAFVALLLVFVKPSGLLLLAAVFASSVLLLVISNRNNTFRSYLKSYSLLSFSVCLLSFLSFYLWSQPYFTRNDIYTPQSFIEYLIVSLRRLNLYFEQFWMEVGDVNIITPLYLLMLVTIFLLLNFYLKLREIKFKLDFSSLPAALVFAAIVFYVLLLFSGEYYNIAASGLILQGRYFLPIATVLLFCCTHNNRLVLLLFLVSITALNIELFSLIPERYLINSWQDLPLLIF